ncbi:MAG TPA: tyrosine-type recombinase/integrase [Kofleriaceae bacterium]|nr:tyrosine-type recombinase/integrase [Kofleriaceae bacterium]
MTPTATDALLTLVQSFFVDYLRRVRGASEHTVRAYRDTLRMFFVFLADRADRPLADLRLDDVRADAVLAFLHHIESKRGNGAVTRNCRLAAIRSFAEHLLRHDVTRAEQYGRIRAIPTKRAASRLVTYLEPEDVRAVIAAVGGQAAASLRDRALLLLLYNTGARVSEALALRPRDLQLERPRQVRLYGKGGKERVCPLWAETAAALRILTIDTASDNIVFRSARGSPLTRDGAAYIIEKYVARAAESRPSLGRRRVTPHVLRHSCAVALLQAGVDVSVIRDYLGHASVATTSRYITTNLEMKREVLKAFWARAGLDHRSTLRWRPSSKLIAFLSSL